MNKFILLFSIGIDLSNKYFIEDAQMQKVMKNEPFLFPTSQLPDFSKMVKPVPNVMRKEFKIQQDVSYNWYADIYGVIYWAILNQKVITINLRSIDKDTGAVISENTEPKYERICSPLAMGIKMGSPNAVKIGGTSKSSVNILLCQSKGYSEKGDVTEPAWRVFNLQNISKIKIESHQEEVFQIPKPKERDKPKKEGEKSKSWWADIVLVALNFQDQTYYFDKGYKKLNFTVI